MSHSGNSLVNPYPIFEKIELGPGMRVADLGCGRTGHFVFPASRLVGERGIVYAVEIVKNILENIKSRVRSEGYPNVQPVWSDIERVGKTPVPDNSLDGCFMVNVLCMLKDKAAALAEANRMLKDGGYMIIVEWARKLGPLGPDSDALMNPETIARYTQGLPFTSVDNFPIGEYHYCALFKKKL